MNERGYGRHLPEMTRLGIEKKNHRSLRIRIEPKLFEEEAGMLSAQ
jgi:hypothetical protein